MYIMDACSKDICDILKLGYSLDCRFIAVIIVVYSVVVLGRRYLTFLMEANKYYYGCAICARQRLLVYTLLPGIPLLC